MGGRQHDVLGDERPRAEVEPFAVRVELQDADALVPVVEVIRTADDGAGWACEG